MKVNGLPAEMSETDSFAMRLAENTRIIALQDEHSVD